MADPSGRPIIWCTAGEASRPAHILWFGEKLALCTAHISCHSKADAAQGTHLAPEHDNMLKATDQSWCKKGCRQTAEMPSRGPLAPLSRHGSQQGSERHLQPLKWPGALLYTRHSIPTPDADHKHMEHMTSHCRVPRQISA